jgi:flagellar biosynthesis/type III secretory pathway chaperone
MSRWGTVLQRHLEELVRLNERLLKAMESRQGAMIARNASRLETLLAEERRLAQAIGEEEQRRQVTMIRLAGELGKAPREIPGLALSEVARLVGEPEGRRLLQLRARLQETVRKTKNLNQAMMMLAQRLLPHFTELLEILLTGTVSHPSYSSGGQTVRAAARMSVLDVRI